LKNKLGVAPMQNQNYNQGQPMQQNQNSDLVDGLFIDTIQTRFGYIDRLGIHRERLINWLMQQQVNDKGYLNVDLLTAQNTGKKYAKLNTYQSQQQVQTPPPYTGNMGQSQQQVQTPPPYTGNMGQSQHHRHTLGIWASLSNISSQGQHKCLMDWFTMSSRGQQFNKDSLTMIVMCNFN
jgi:hypothetical protein